MLRLLIAMHTTVVIITMKLYRVIGELALEEVTVHSAMGIPIIMAVVPGGVQIRVSVRVVLFHQLYLRIAGVSIMETLLVAGVWASSWVTGMTLLIRQ